MKKLFRYQFWQLLSAIVLIAAIKIFIDRNQDIMDGSLWGLTTHAWFWVAIGVPIVHQVYVWIVWRLELYYRTFSSRFGVSKAFKLYTVGFSLLFVSRLITIIILALSNPGSWSIEPLIAYIIAALITPLVVYLFYSVKKYFTVERAYGIDHFDKDFNEPFVKKGIFRYTDNGMYVFGLMILYLPGLLLLSKAALIVAAFNHIYIWAHYYCTERPDMEVIYGKTSAE